VSKAIENWSCIEGYDNYKISTCGRVKDTNTKRIINAKKSNVKKVIILHAVFIMLIANNIHSYIIIHTAVQDIGGLDWILFNACSLNTFLSHEIQQHFILLHLDFNTHIPHAVMLPRKIPTIIKEFSEIKSPITQSLGIIFLYYIY
jgi:hypothetical protein|tara:strand:- start:1641 stop:2078 length:438 start_codon:yes stop_codon:yes gene_type:complete